MGKEIITFVFPTNKPNACLSAFNALITFVVCFSLAQSPALDS